MLGWILSHHVALVASTLLALLFSGAILDRRRPVGSAFAWLFIIGFLPFVGIPLFFMFGGRKFAAHAAEKPRLDAPRSDTHGFWGLRWLDTGEGAFGCFLEEIARADHTIQLVTFVVGDDATGRAVLSALCARAKAGVRVELLLDGFLAHQAPRDALSALANAGGTVERFMPLLHLPGRQRSNLRNHRKIAVFDGRVAIVGGMNLASEYMGQEPEPARWRDLSVRLEGPAVVALAEIFDADFAFARRKRLGRKVERATHAARMASLLPAIPPDLQPLAQLDVVPSGPHTANDAIYDRVLTAIFRADRRIWVATPYFVPDDALTRALEVALRRGVEVCIVVPLRSNHLVTDIVAAPVLRALRNEGARVYRYPHMLHAKALLIDDVAVVGSANFDMRSLWLDYEIALFLPGKPEVTWLDAWFSALFSGPHANASDAEPSFLRRGLESVARLLSPLL
jgi:cardiolipin synthase